MSLPAAASLLAGVVVLTVLASDVFATVLHHWGGRGTVGRRLAQAIWSAALRVVRGMPAAPRRRVLGWIGPALIPIMIGAWAFLAVLGFALIYLPWIPTSFQSRDPFTFTNSFLDAFYYSGVTFFTLGYGDLVPTSTGTRLLALIQGGSGFALITLAVSYFTSLYAAYMRQKVAAESIYHQAGDSADVVHFIINHRAGGGSWEALEGEIAGFRDNLIRISSDYRQYPLLYHFTPHSPERSFLRLLFLAHDLVLVLDTAIDADANPKLAGLGRQMGLERAADAFTASAAEFLLSGTTRDESGRAADGHHAAERYQRAREALRESGYRVRDGEKAVDDYVRARVEWERVLRACAYRLGEDWILITGRC